MGVEFLILTIYFICVTYVLYQMALSVEAKLEDQVRIVLNAEILQSTVTTQLNQQSLYHAEAEVETQGQEKKEDKALLKITFFYNMQPVGLVALQVSPVGKLPLEPSPKNLLVSVTNTLPDQQVFIDWDQSAISAYGGAGQRVIRQVPGSPTDLLQAQVYTVVNPGLQTKVAVTSENLLKRPDNQMALEVDKALINFSQIPEIKEPRRQYSLQMLMWVRSMSNPNSPALQILVPFVFRIELLPDHVALPVLSWILNFDPFAPNPSQKTR